MFLKTPQRLSFFSAISLVIFAFWTAYSSLARAELSLEITTEGLKQIPLAMLPFANERDLTTPVSPIVIADLQRTGLFRQAEVSGVNPIPTETSQLKLAEWRAKQATAVLIGSTSIEQDGKIKIRYVLVDVATEQEKLIEVISVPPSQLRGAAHRIADAVYEKLTGEKGVFSTKISYIVKDGPSYQLRVADADAYNERTILSSKEPIISPKWSPDGSRMAYVTFELKRPLVVVQNLSTGARKVVANFRGNNSAPAWSPDGKRLAVTLSRDGIAQIYTIDAEGLEQPRRLMTTRAIDTEAVFTPDGKSVLFTSDRGGSPQIYKVPVEGGNAQRLTFTGNYNVSPRLSPDGKKLVFIQQNGSAFRVMLQDLDTNQLQNMSDNALDESPSFSPNGRMILYASRANGKGVLALVSADGRVRQKFSTQAGDVYEPAWGPLQ
jgi:TolB protein